MQYQQPPRLSDWLRRDDPQCLNRKEVSIVAGNDLASGQVIGKKKFIVPTTGTAGTNVGDGTVTAVTGADSLKLGTYALIAESATVFAVIDPDGMRLGNAIVDSVYEHPQIVFTINAGGTAFTSDDTFTIDVTEGDGKCVPINPAATDGSQIVYGILYAPVDATAVAASASIGVASTNAVDLEAVEPGLAGNSISLAFVDPGAANQTLSVTVEGDPQNGHSITVNLATDGGSAITTTPADIVSAIDADSSAKLLIVATANGSSAVAAGGVTLSGGVDYAHNNRGVVVTGNAGICLGGLTHTGYSADAIKPLLENAGFTILAEA